MFYYLYEIKNLINDHIYVGVHKTKNMDDGYMGSGKVILRAIETHGAENFAKTILETFETSDAMFAREKEVVTDEFLARPDTYNLRRGGFGGFDHINKAGFVRNSSHFSNGNTESVRGGISSRDKHTGMFSSDSILKARSVLRELYPNGTFYGKRHSELTLVKMRDGHTGAQTGSKNSQFGTMWITDGKKNKKCSSTGIIPEGWSKGRISKI
jgi:hypothetical protein